VSDDPEPASDADLEAWLDYAQADGDIGSAETAPGWLRWTVGAAVAATVIGLVLLWPPSTTAGELGRSVIGVSRSVHSAEVTVVSTETCAFPDDTDCVTVTFLIETGPDAGATFTQEFPATATTPEFAVGQIAVLSKRDPEGTVISGSPLPCSFDDTLECRMLRIRLNDAAATIVAAEVSPESPAYNTFAGDEVNLDLFDEGGELVVFAVDVPTIATNYQFADFQRRPLLFWLVVLFAVAVVLVGRRQGLLALVGLALSVVLLLLFVVQGIVAGSSPLPIAVVGAAAIAILTLYLAHGFTVETSVALLGVLGAIVLTAILGTVVLALANIGGFSSEETSLLTLFENVQVRGLLLAGVVLGAAGALDDVAVTQAAAVREIHSANPALGKRELYQRGMRVGRDHIASTVNTLLLAYAGASLPLLVLFVLSKQSLGTVANSEVVAIEVLRTIVGSFGLLATVPFTTWVAASATRPEATS